ncbi:endonuclease/exonuclease/phosphatase family domain-containing protein 1-like [Littorina saxatilis]|uniref:Endonuclease/exonuclease/phosphatase family domain-containing protein 1 n=1 Tax=Littorina saxatilis TaxID=31220 RepID=A0AAN9BY76_9CAEN
MGGVNGCFIPRHHHDEPKENGGLKGSKFKGHRRNLSATFNLSIIEDESESQSFVNINSATEEELMTLPGINRAIAKNIIDYRRQIGGYRRVEDLALVSGVGAEKLGRIRCDITIGIRNNGPASRDGSLHGSRVDGDSVRESKNGKGSNSQTLVNVNSANMFQLIKIKGLGMNLAENIVTYREKNGPYKSLDDLVKVKGIGGGILSAIRPYLCIDSSSPDTLPVPLSPSLPGPRSYPIIPNGKTPEDSGDASSVLPSNPTPLSDYQRRSMTSIENLLTILGPLAEVPKRPQLSEPFNFRHKNRRVVRVASWNLEQCSLDKVSNPGVKDVVCMSILENGFGIVAVQELSHDKALEEICQELNQPTLPNVRRWSGQRGKWKCAVSQVAGRMYRSVEYNGFLYDSSQNIELMSANLLEAAEENGKRLFARMPYVGFFRVNGQLDCVVVSVHLKATGLEGEDLDRTKAEVASMTDVLKSIADHVPSEKDVILVGDFNLGPDSEEFEKLRKKGYTNMIKVDTPTNISANNPAGSKCYDNIWISQQTLKVHSGKAGVVREGLTSPWIPNGWKWGGVVSDHCPVYTELYTNNDLDKGDLSIGADGIRFIIGADSG